MDVTSENACEVTKKEDKKVSSDEEPVSAILEKLSAKYKAPSTKISLTDAYNNLWVVLSRNR